MLIEPARFSATDEVERWAASYNSQVRLQVEEGNYGKIVAIDIETGDYE